MKITLNFKYRFEAEMFVAFIEDCHIDIPKVRESETGIAVEADVENKDESEFIEDCYRKFNELPCRSFFSELENFVDEAQSAWEDRTREPSAGDFLVND